MNCLLILNLNYDSLDIQSPLHCFNINKVVKEIKSLRFDRKFIINDDHFKDDKEFNYLPKHNQQQRKTPIDYELSNNHLWKNSLSALTSQYNRSLIVDKFDEICVTGCVGQFDVISTLLDMINYKQNCYIYENCIGDLSEEYLKKTLEYIKFIGVKCL